MGNMHAFAAAWIILCYLVWRSVAKQLCLEVASALSVMALRSHRQDDSLSY